VLLSCALKIFFFTIQTFDNSMKIAVRLLSAALAALIALVIFPACSDSEKAILLSYEQHVPVEILILASMQQQLDSLEAKADPALEAQIKQLREKVNVADAALVQFVKDYYPLPTAKGQSPGDNPSSIPNGRLTIPGCSTTDCYNMVSAVVVPPRPCKCKEFEFIRRPGNPYPVFVSRIPNLGIRVFDRGNGLQLGEFKSTPAINGLFMYSSPSTGLIQGQTRMEIEAGGIKMPLNIGFTFR